MNNIFVVIIGFLYRIRWWLILGTSAVTIWACLFTGDMTKVYEVSTTVYTGVVSGYGIQSTEEGTSVSQGSADNAMDNLLNILISKATLNRVSLRLYAQHMMYGDPNTDNRYIQASNFREIYSSTPQEVRDLIDKSSEENTLKNLYAYQERSYDNHVYGLFNWTHRFYSYEALKKIEVRRVGSSDMIDILYRSSDPGVAYNTLLLLTEEFSNQYQNLRYGETDSVIKYFEDELQKARAHLRVTEDSLTDYSVANKVINYAEQSKHVAALSRDFELVYEEILRRYESTKKQIEILDARIGEYTRKVKSSSDFLATSDKITNLAAQITQIELFKEKTPEEIQKLKALKAQLTTEEAKFKDFVKLFGEAQYSNEGISNLAFIEQWLQAKVDYEKAAAELRVMEERRIVLDDKYVELSPVGTTVKGIERELSFTESTYLSVLHGLNMAKLRKKNLQLTGASLQVINPPIYPLISKPTKRKLVVAGAAMGSFLFILGIFLLIELLDRTLRDKRRTESMTGIKVLGGIPAPMKYRLRAYGKKYEEIADQYLANALMNFHSVNGRLIITLTSLAENGEKEKLAQRLYNVWMQAELNVKVVICGEDYFTESKEYMFAEGIERLADIEGYEVVLLILPAINKAPIPQNLISKASINLVLLDANSVWREADQLLIDNFVARSEKTPVRICLSMCNRVALEAFTGLLPPYTRTRKLAYRLLHLGITSSSH